MTANTDGSRRGTLRGGFFVYFRPSPLPVAEISQIPAFLARVGDVVATTPPKNRSTDCTLTFKALSLPPTPFHCQLTDRVTDSEVGMLGEVLTRVGLWISVHLPIWWVIFMPSRRFQRLGGYWSADLVRPTPHD